MRLLFKKYVHESMLLWLACGLMLVLFCWVRVWIVCQFELQQFESLLEQLRPFEKFSPVPLSQLLTYAGSLAMTFDEPVLILCILVWSIARGSDVVSGEINRGTMEMLLAQPISRIRIMVAHMTICVVGLSGLCGCVYLGLYLGIHTNVVKETVSPTVKIPVLVLPVEIPIQVGRPETRWVALSDRVDSQVLVAPTLNLFGFGFLVLGYSVLCSACDKFRWRTIGIVVASYVIQFLLYLLSKAAEATQFCAYMTFFSCYQPDAMVQMLQDRPGGTMDFFAADSPLPVGLGPLGTTCVLLGIGLAMFVTALFVFQRRDLPAPV